MIDYIDLLLTVIVVYRRKFKKSQLFQLFRLIPMTIHGTFVAKFRGWAQFDA